MIYDNIKKSTIIAAKNNVSLKSDNLMVRNFFNQFTSVIKQQMQNSNQIYLVDILDQLNFISVDTLLRSSDKIKILFK